MKKQRITYLICLLFLFLSQNAFEQTVKVKDSFKTLNGQYKSDHGLRFFIEADNTFFILKGHNKALDATIAGCDTIARGNWNYLSESVIKLSNDTAYQKIKYNLTEENKLSSDSVYIKLELPKDDAFFNGRFEFQFTLFGKMDPITTKSQLITLPKKKIFTDGDLYYHLGLSIQDLYPINCNLDGKCYQKIYFDIFNDCELKTKANYFIVKLLNFNECYVERADINNELVFINKNKLHWQNLEFEKIK